MIRPVRNPDGPPKGSGLNDWNLNRNVVIEPPTLSTRGLEMLRVLNDILDVDSESALLSAETSFN